ncbi:phage holin family protein [Brevundimonas sp.]|uniref:phage holin family protein n=1 Tax=Brevundimonas sp. TaxID=1871086 RepID=UPI00262B6486|nr:phage holin family protein [Brevundimonas sp.]
MLRFILQAVVTALGLWLAAWLVPGVEFLSTGSLIAAAVLLGLVNGFVRPVLVFVTFPLTLITFGLFLLVVNAATIGIVASLLGGFVVDGLWAGVGAAVVTGVVSWIAGSIISDDRRPKRD